MNDRSPSPLRIQPQQQRALEKIERILDATADLLTVAGLDAVTPATVAKKAELPSATVYHYFENRHALLVGLADRTMTQVDNAILAALAQLTPSQEPNWKTVVRLIYDSYHCAPGYITLLSALRSSPQLRKTAENSNLRVAFALAEILQQYAALEPQRLLRVAKLVNKSVQAMLELALTTTDTAEAEAFVAEMQEMLDCLYQHYLLKQNPNT